MTESPNRPFDPERFDAFVRGALLRPNVSANRIEALIEGTLARADASHNLPTSDLPSPGILAALGSFVPQFAVPMAAALMLGAYVAKAFAVSSPLHMLTRLLGYHQVMPVGF